METQLVSPQPRGMQHIENVLVNTLQCISDLPQPLIVWSIVRYGIELPLQAVRSCYTIEDVTEDDIYLALFLPSYENVGFQNWEYVPETNTISTTDKLFAACLKKRGRKVVIKSFLVGLVYSEVMEELEKRSTKTMRKFLDILKHGVYFCFKECTMDDGINALSRSIEKGAIGFKNEYLSCKSFRVALELVNITGRAPILVAQKQAMAIA